MRHGADVKRKTPQGRTALHAATGEDRLEAVKVLLEFKGIKVNELTPQGETALHIAYRRNTPVIVETLLEKGADPSIRTPAGKTAAELAPYRTAPSRP